MATTGTTNTDLVKKPYRKEQITHAQATELAKCIQDPKQELFPLILR